MEVQNLHQILLTYRHGHIRFQRGRREAPTRWKRKELKRATGRTSEPDRDTECAPEHHTHRAAPWAHPCTPAAAITTGSRISESHDPFSSRSRPVAPSRLQPDSEIHELFPLVLTPPLPALRLPVPVPAPVATHKHLRRLQAPTSCTRRTSRRRRANVPLPGGERPSVI